MLTPLMLTLALLAPPPQDAWLRRGLDAVRDLGVIGAVAEVRDGARLLSARTGTADRATRRPVPRRPQIRIASGTKAFTATVLRQLCGEGKLSLDDSASRWLPRLDARITVRHLLQHTSGLPDYFRDPAAWPQLRAAAGFLARRLRTHRPSELVALALKHPPLFPPGTRWSYSNTNDILAGMLIEKITGQTWAQQVRQRAIHGPHAHAYRRYPDAPGPTDVTEVNPSMGGAAGAIITSATDLNRFQQALNSGRLLRPAQLLAMRTTVETDAEAQSVWPGAVRARAPSPASWRSLAGTPVWPDDHMTQLDVKCRLPHA
ncbi:serine hydrolase domain-containing protein [Nonomuraea sp. NPDC050540]|uniref:serine hydrolase domain-containing protein n=1 Tax=Nonomuraea sp. NPDC050540 TaxID=3364367 RepID=UPI0037B18513